MSQTAIRIQGVSKKYTIGKQKDGSLRGTLASLFSKSKSQQTEFMALKDVSFTVKQGEVVGIIGKNGAGKSTLLKVLSQITKPSSGRIELNGRVASLLEVGTGFHPELTGRENVFLNGTILGMTRKEVAAKFDEIVAFSGVEKFIDTPVKHYSSGMYVRLAFAVAAHLEPEILIIDEVLAVGDAEFQKKCLGKMKDVAGEGRTVLFVSHQLGSVKQLCTKGILLEQGKVKRVGDITDVITEYQKGATATKYFNDDTEKSFYLKEAKFKTDDNDFSFVDTIQIDFKIAGKGLGLEQPCSLLIRVFDSNDMPITSFEIKKVLKDSYTLAIPSNYLKKGNYYINAILYQPAIEVYDQVDCLQIQIIDNNSTYAHLELFDSGRIYADESWLK